MDEVLNYNPSVSLAVHGDLTAHGIRARLSDARTMRITPVKYVHHAIDCVLLAICRRLAAFGMEGWYRRA